MITLIVYLPFTPEGCPRANSISLVKSGKPSQVVAAHIQYITTFPDFSDSYPNKIHKLCDKLVVIVQALDTMNKLRDMKV